MHKIYTWYTQHLKWRKEIEVKKVQQLIAGVYGDRVDVKVNAAKHSNVLTKQRKVVAVCSMCLGQNMSHHICISVCICHLMLLQWVKTIVKKIFHLYIVKMPWDIHHTEDFKAWLLNWCWTGLCHELFSPTIVRKKKLLSTKEKSAEQCN